MKVFRRRSIIGAFVNKWRKLSGEVLASALDYEKLIRWLEVGEEEADDPIIPKDVPKGHMVVYVGEEHRRFVIRVTFLEHPLFQALLDRAREEYEFIPDSKLCIPCDENFFLGILRHVASQQDDRRIWLCS